MQPRLPNTPMNRGASEQIYYRAYMAVCASVYVCSVWTAIEGNFLNNHRPSIAELGLTCVDVVKKKKEKVKTEDIVSCYIATL